MNNDIVLTRTLATQGFNADDLARLSRTGELTRVRRGAYAYAPGNDLARAQQHRRVVVATAPMLLGGSVISHGSAAALHGLPVWQPAVEKVHVTCSRSGHGKRRSLVHVHGAPLPPTDLAVIDGVVITSLARTVLDLARTRPMEEVVAAGDLALRLGLQPADLGLGLLRM
jgi:predicted transcriptional regulator of viral defense system